MGGCSRMADFHLARWFTEENGYGGNLDKGRVSVETLLGNVYFAARKFKIKVEPEFA